MTIGGWSWCVPAVLLSAGAVCAQWDPAGGDWTQSTQDDVRVLTWNVHDAIRSECDKSEGLNPWTAAARIIAALRPDVLLLQEAGDNGSAGADSAEDLAVTIGLFLHGGTDPFVAGNPVVTAYVTRYAAAYDVPFVFVSHETDGYNRNVILSRYPFSDLNGDGRGTISDIPTVSADVYAPGGDGGVRGFQFAEMTLPDAVFLGDLVVGNGHLKSGGGSSNAAARLAAAQNVAYTIDYWFNGAGTGVPDPHDALADEPAALTVLDDWTPVVFGGDWNEDELLNGVRGPADWLTQAAMPDDPSDSAGASRSARVWVPHFVTHAWGKFVDCAGRGAAGDTARWMNALDGTDRDRSDARYDHAVHVFTGSRATFDGMKFDYLAFQDSIAFLRRAFVFDTAGTPAFALPTEVMGFPFPRLASTYASDHRPVIVDLILPQIGDSDQDGDVDLDDFTVLHGCITGPGGGVSAGCQPYDADRDGDVDLLDYGAFTARFNGPT